MIPDETPFDFVVRRDDPRETAFLPAPPPREVDVPAEHVLLEIERFGFSANNITYTAMGEVMRYWDFFPAPEGWGKVPVWGFARVVRSRHEDLAEGERVFGYLPTSTHVVMQPDRVSPAGFLDAIEHRASLPGVYQRYSRLRSDRAEDASSEDQQALWQPLFMTSFGLADFLTDNDFFGARTVAFSSASSKTALGTAFLLSDIKSKGTRVAALTSGRNREFCQRVGYYGSTITYEDIDSLPVEGTLLVDLAANATLVAALREHLADDLVHVVAVGATHWDQRGDGELGGTGSTFFFLPTWMEKRRNEWGRREFAERYESARNGFFPSASQWLKVVRSEGRSGLEAVYVETLEGRAKPQVGHIVTLGGQRAGV